MLTIVGDVIEYDGKPFAIITAPLSGWRMNAIDAVNNHEMFLQEVISDTVDEERSDDKDAVLAIIDRAETEIWLAPEISEWLEKEIRKLF